MSKRKQLSREIGHSLMTWSKKVTERSIIKHVYSAQDLSRQRMARIMKAEGISQYEILKVRADGRCIARADHPEYGKVVVKSGAPSRNPAKAYANLHLARMIQESGGGLFPIIHSAALGYTVEAWVEGWEVSTLAREEIAVGDIQDLLERIKKWSLANATGEAMYPEDIQDTTMKYARTIFFSLRKKSNVGIARKTYELYWGRRHLTNRLYRLQHLAMGISLPQCMALEDLGLVNLVMESRKHSILVIDHERAMQTHYGFDAAYVLHCLYKMNVNAPTLSALEAYAFRSTYMGSEEATEFFQAFYETLNELRKAVS